MEPDSEAFWFAVGIAGSIALGIAMIPLRGLTPAANFTFVFMALTIIVAELGGRRAAIASAVTSALSLDFFLTEPYLKLTIADKHDVIAFAGLGACGLIAAAFGQRHEQREASRRHLELLHEALQAVEEAGPPAATLSRVLDKARVALQVASLAVHDEHGELVAATDRVANRPDPTVALPLIAGNRRTGKLEVWTAGRPVTPTERKVLSDLGRVIGARLALEAQPVAPAR